MKKKIRRDEQYVHDIPRIGIVYKEAKRYLYLNDDWSVILFYGKPVDKSVREPRKIKKRRNKDYALAIHYYIF